jgi:hypothetical protein
MPKTLNPYLVQPEYIETYKTRERRDIDKSDDTAFSNKLCKI